MADGKVCAKCNMGISAQEIIDGRAKLVKGHLVCAMCARTLEAKPAAKSAESPLAMPKDDSSAPLTITHGGQAAAENATTKVPEAAEGGEHISVFSGAAQHGRQEAHYNRTPVFSGKGAIRVKTFDTKLTRAAMEMLDEQINTFLEQNGYEAKFVTTVIGEVQSKTTEQHLIINVWY